MSKSNVIALSQPGTFTDLLTEVLRTGARALLAKAVEVEAADFLEQHADLKTADGRRRVVRHGHLPERAVMTGVGAVDAGQSHPHVIQHSVRFGRAGSLASEDICVDGGRERARAGGIGGIGRAAIESPPDQLPCGGVSQSAAKQAGNHDDRIAIRPVKPRSTIVEDTEIGCGRASGCRA